MSLMNVFRPRVQTFLFLAIFFIASMLVYFFNSNSLIRGTSHERALLPPGASDVALTPPSPDFATALRTHADGRGYIILVSVDYGYIDMALNFYESSLKKLALDNFLFVTSDSRASEALDQRNISNFNYFNDKDGSSSSNYATLAFARKTHYKTKIILDALKLDLTVLISDVDIVLFKNPFPFMDCEECDLQITDDILVGNSGFYLARPTPGAIELHERAWTNSLANPNRSNQKQLNDVIRKMKSKKTLRHVTLSLQLFPCGKSYFEDGFRMFAGDHPCAECVMVHDNWIVSNQAKIYRFKEHLMWYVDERGYYSDLRRKYLTFDNPVDFGTGKTAEYEKQALKAALAIGHLLNRTVILPTFQCNGCKHNICKSPSKRCALNAVYRVVDFDQAFDGVYREHVFLQHELVPQEVKTSQSSVILIDSETVRTKQDSSLTKDLVHFAPSDSSLGASSQEILEWFNTEEYSQISVLRFHSLYNSFSGLAASKHAAFQKKLDSGFKKSTYRQYA